MVWRVEGGKGRCALAVAVALALALALAVAWAAAGLAARAYHSFALSKHEWPKRCLNPYALNCLTKKAMRLCLKYL